MKLLLQYLLAGACCYYGFASSPTCDFFVSYARGSDGGAGTLAEPFKTIPHAAYKVSATPILDYFIIVVVIIVVVVIIIILFFFNFILSQLHINRPRAGHEPSASDQMERIL